MKRAATYLTREERTTQFPESSHGHRHFFIIIILEACTSYKIYFKSLFICLLYYYIAIVPLRDRSSRGEAGEQKMMAGKGDKSPIYI